MPNIIEITDFHAPELDPYARLTQNQLRNRLEPEKGIFIAESPKVISRALDAGYQPLSLLMERKQITGPAAERVTAGGVDEDGIHVEGRCTAEDGPHVGRIHNALQNSHPPGIFAEFFHGTGCQDPGRTAPGPAL